MAAEEILMEIDATLDRLIQNAEAIAGADMEELSITELDAFQKTQESLIQHLLHTDQRLEVQRKCPVKSRLETLDLDEITESRELSRKSKSRFMADCRMDKRSASFKIAEKRARFEKLKSSYHKTISETIEQKLPILSKRRAKRFFTIR